jgi:Protein of unknown function (DUF1203)
MTDFQIKSLRDDEFTALFHLDDKALQQQGAIRMTVTTKPGFPCRVSLEDAEPGEEVLLLPYRHHHTHSSYQSSGPVFVRKTGRTAAPGINEIPFMLQHRLLSLRGYDSNGMMKNALVTEGKMLAENLHYMFEAEEISYIHIHNAKAGCYNCLVERV